MRLAEEVLDAWAPIMIEVSLRTGGKGRFEVSLDERTLFSKSVSGRFPKEGEILGLARPILGDPIDWR